MGGKKGFTPETIEKMTTRERATLYTNALKIDSEEARHIVLMIERARLPFSDGGAVKLDDPLTQAIRTVIRSDAGRQACIDATEKGQPAIAGVDYLLAAKFGSDYGKHNQTTHWAGKLVAEVMAEMGYVQVGREVKAPIRCVAREGELYRKRGRT